MAQKKTTQTSKLDSSHSTGKKARLRLPTREEFVACEDSSDWFLLALEKNPHADYDTLRSAYERSTSSRGPNAWPRLEDSMNDENFEAFQKAVKAGSQAVAEFKAHRAHAREVPRRLKASKTWEEWARLYISEHPTAKAWQVRDAMIGATHSYARLIDLSEKLGKFPGMDRIESWQLKAGAGGMTPEKLREHRARRAQPARPSKATRGRPPGARSLRATLFSKALLKRNEPRSDEDSSPPARPLKPLKPLKQVPLSSATRKFFAQFHVPKTLQNFLERHSYKNYVGLGQLTFDPVNSFSRESLDTNHVFIKNGLLVVGSGLNGDPLAVDLATFSIGYLNHEGMWGDEDEEQDVRDPERFVDTGLDPGTFFLAATLYEKGFPVDSYAARALQENFKGSSFAELFLLSAG